MEWKFAHFNSTLSRSFENIPQFLGKIKPIFFFSFSNLNSLNYKPPPHSIWMSWLTALIASKTLPHSQHSPSCWSQSHSLCPSSSAALPQTCRDTFKAFCQRSCHCEHHYKHHVASDSWPGKRLGFDDKEVRKKKKKVSLWVETDRAPETTQAGWKHALDGWLVDGGCLGPGGWEWLKQRCWRVYTHRHNVINLIHRSVPS